MKNTSLMNGGLIGFGLGFIASSLTLHRLVSDFLPGYAEVWYLQGIGIIGGVGLVIGIAFETYERIKARRMLRPDAEDDEDDEMVEETE
ncbi:hypothetical protein ACFLUG_02440 [Chloroflexota bacterium]